MIFVCILLIIPAWCAVELSRNGKFIHFSPLYCFISLLCVCVYVCFFWHKVVAADVCRPAKTVTGVIWHLKVEDGISE